MKAKIKIYQQQLNRMNTYDSKKIKDFKEIVTSIRTIRSELNIAPSKKIDIIVSVKSDLEINTINSTHND